MSTQNTKIQHFLNYLKEIPSPVSTNKEFFHEKPQ